MGCPYFTVFDLSKDFAGYLWHEAEGDLTANAFASCVTGYVHVDNLDERIEEVTVYSDGCTYQNRMLC